MLKTKNLASVVLALMIVVLIVGVSVAIPYEVRDARINDYFREANENVGALDCDVRIHKRDVPDELKRAIKARDHFKCVICGSTVKLEVDHRRALENGGDNSPDNLATLCDDCHTIKTRYDHSLRRKRQKLCWK